MNGGLAFAGGGLRLFNGGLMTQEQYEKCCCDLCTPCCARLKQGEYTVNNALTVSAGTFDAAGDLVFETERMTVKVIMPDKNKRLICDGMIIRIEATLKPGFDPNEANFAWMTWADRAFRITDFGIQNGTAPTVDTDNYVEWTTDGPDAFVELQYTHCYADHSAAYGKIVFCSLTEDDCIELDFETCPLSPTDDCCTVDDVCTPCCIRLDKNLPEPQKPEAINGVWTYEMLGAFGWRLRVEVTGIDPNERLLCKLGSPKGFGINIIAIPPSDYEQRTSNIKPGFCVNSPGWIAGGPRATACPPAAYVASADSCGETTRWPDGDEDLEKSTGVTLIDCESDCPEKPPEAVTVSMTGEYDQGGATRDVTIEVVIEIEDCPNPENIDCTCPSPCCLNPIVTIDHPDGNGAWDIDAVPPDGFLISGTFDAPISQPGTPDGVWGVECHPPGDPNPTFWILTASAGNNPGVTSGIQPVTTDLQVIWQPNQGYPPITINVTCND